MDLPIEYSGCIDTSALVDMKRLYGREVFENLWADIEKLIADKKLLSPREVLAELEQYGREDEILVWARKNRSMFVDLDEEQTALAQGIVKRFPTLVKASKTTADADPFVIALAKSKGTYVVASEKPSRSREKPKIPDVCQDKEYNVKCLNLFDFFREQGWKY